MTTKLRRSLFAVLSCGLLACGMQGQPNTQERVNPEARILQDFQTRLKNYRELHERVEKQGPRLKETTDPGGIAAARDALAQNLRAARKDAHQGDIFTPEVRQLFRRLMYPELKGSDGRETKEAIKEDAPAGVPLKVNATYPEDQPLPTVPPNILASLPKLPEDLEYRIVGKHLILRDVDANLIVDVIPNAIR